MSVEQVQLEIPTDPVILKKIADRMEEIANSKTRQKAEADLQTEIFQNLAEETGVPNSYLRALATAEAQGGVDKMIRKVEDVEALYVAISNYKPGNLPAGVTAVTYTAAKQEEQEDVEA